MKLDAFEKFLVGYIFISFSLFVIVGIIGYKTGNRLTKECEAKGGIYVNNLCLRKDSVIE